MGRGVLVHPPRAALETGPFEGAQHAPAPVPVERPPDDVVQKHILGGEHGAPDHLAFPGAVLSLKIHQAGGRALRCGAGVRRLRLARAAAPWIADPRHGAQKRAGQRVAGPLVPSSTRGFLPVQLHNRAQEPPETHGEGQKDVAGLARSERPAGLRNSRGDPPDRRRAERKAELDRGPVLAGEYPRGPVSVRGIRPPTPVDRLSERHRFRPVIGKDLVESHREELRAAGGTESPGDEVAKYAALGERQRVAESQGHTHGGHGVVVPRRVPDKHAARVPVRNARPQPIGRGVEIPHPQRRDERGPERVRQQAGTGFRQKAHPIPGRPAIQRHVDDDPDATVPQTVYEDRPRPAEQHMSETLERQADIVQRNPEHPRAEHRVGRQAERLTDDRSPAVGADNPRGAQKSIGPVHGISQPLVFDPVHPRAENKVDPRLVLDRFAQLRDEHRVIACQTQGLAQIGKDDGFRAVFRKDHEPLALAASGQCVDLDPDVAQYPYGGRMQPFARQPSGRLGVRLEEGHPGALSRVGEGAQAAHRAGADHGYVVAARYAAAHRKTLGSERRR